MRASIDRASCARDAAGSMWGGQKPGQAIVEFSLILLVLGGVFMVALDLGRATTTYLAVVHATREAARVASLDTTTNAQVQSAARDAAAGIVPPANLSITCNTGAFSYTTGTFTPGAVCPDPRAPGTAFAVAASTTFQPVLPIISFASGAYTSGPITVRHQIYGVVMDEP